MADKKEKTAAYKSYDDFLKIKTAGDLEKFYIFFGDEHYVLNSCITNLKKLALAGGDATFNYRRIDGQNPDPDELSEALEALPAFAEKTFIEVRDLDIYKCDEEITERLISIFNDIPDYCCLVIFYDTIDFSEDKRKKKLHESVKNNAVLFEMNAQDRNKLIRWIQKRFAAHGQSISVENCEYLIMLCGDLMNGLISEIEKISAYAQQKEIKKSDIDAVAVPVPEAQIFKLSNAIAEKHFDEASDVLDTLLNMNESPYSLVGLIGSQCRRLYIAKQIKLNGGGAAQLCKVLAMKDYPAKLLLGNAAKFSLEWCEKAVLACAETDYQMKNAPISAENLLKSLFLHLAGENN